MTEEDVITIAAQHITKGDFMGAMEIFENHVNENPKDPAGYHGWAEAAMFEICLLYTSPSPRDGLLSRMPSSA